MDDYETPEGGTPEINETFQNNDSIESSTWTQTGIAEAPESSAAPSFEQPQDTWQPPYAGNQPQGAYQQPGIYQQPGAYQQPNYYRPQYPNPQQYNNYTHPARGKATASLVLGIISLVFFWMSFFAIISVICSIIGIVLGNSARKELRPEQGQGQATAGLVCSIIGLVLSVIMLVVFTLLIVAAFSFVPEFSDFYM
jgi:hypothetical protein